MPKGIIAELFATHRLTGYERRVDRLSRHVTVCRRHDGPRGGCVECGHAGHHQPGPVHQQG